MIRCLLPLAFLAAACAGSAQSVVAPCAPCATSTAPPIASAAPARSAELDALAHRRLELAQKAVLILRVQFQSGSISLTQYLAASKRVAFAARDSKLSPAELRPILEEHVQAMKKALELARARYPAVVSDDVVAECEYDVAEAEYWLAELSGVGSQEGKR